MLAAIKYGNNERNMLDHNWIRLCIYSFLQWTSYTIVFWWRQDKACARVFYENQDTQQISLHKFNLFLTCFIARGLQCRQPNKYTCSTDVDCAKDCFRDTKGRSDEFLIFWCHKRVEILTKILSNIESDDQPPWLRRSEAQYKREPMKKYAFLTYVKVDRMVESEKWEITGDSEQQSYALSLGSMIYASRWSCRRSWGYLWSLGCEGKVNSKHP